MAHDALDTSELPEAVVDRAEEILEGASQNTRLCGISTQFEGYALESHTLGCRYEAGDPEEEWWERHYDIYDDYFNDGFSWIIGDPTDGVFVTINKMRKLK